MQDIYSSLKNDIRSKINKNKLYGSDCNLLSKKIYEATKRRISDSTLKRFFGLIKSNHNPSKYTLDTLSEFVGFENWNDYSKFHGYYRPISEEDRWEVLKTKLMAVTTHSMESLIQKTNYSKNKFIFRAVLKERFERFEASKIPATMFIAPEGYGKSSLMIQLVEKYFLNENKKFENDIVCLIDGGIFFNLYSKNGNIDLLNQLVEFKIEKGFNFYFQKNPKKRKGRLWLLFDGVDDIFFDYKRYFNLIKNIMQILMVNEGGWFKVILTCNPENLDVFMQLFNKNPILKAIWFDIEFSHENYLDVVNISPLNTKEIKAIFKRYNVESKFKSIFTQYKDVLEIISHPHSLSLFINDFKQNEEISDIILINRYIKTKILSPPFLEQKLLLVKRYITLCNRCKETMLVEKTQLLHDSALIPSYQQFISDGILYEFIIPNDTIDLRIMISFTQKIILEYIVLHEWTQGKNYSVELFEKIVVFYKNNKTMQCAIIKLFMKMLMHSNKLELAKEIYDKSIELGFEEESEQNVSKCIEIIATTFNQLQRKNEELRKLFKS